MPNEELTQQVESLKQELADIKKSVDLLKLHQHLGVDGSTEFLGQTEFVGRSMTLGGGVASGDQIFAPLVLVDNTFSNVLSPSDKSARTGSLSMWVNDKYSSGEQASTMMSTIKSPPAAELSMPIDNFDWTQYSEGRLRVAVNHQGSAALSGPSVFGPLSFILGERSPNITSYGTVSSGGSTLTDSNAKFGTDSLVGSIINITNDDTTIIESYKILTNTDTVITMGQYLSDGSAELASFGSSAGTYRYYIVCPMLLGGAEIPYDRGYFGQDIRLGYGSSSGDQVLYIKWGNGTPEGVVTANIGSLYLRKDGGAGTVLYVKESGNGTSTGWSTTA